MKRRTLRNDLIMIISLIATFAIALVVLYFTRTSANLVATVYVQNNVVKRVNLNGEDQEFTIKGKNGDLTVEVLNKKIAVTKSNCPHQDCVKIGFVGETNRPIICAYNEVYIKIEGSFNNDIEI